MRLLAEELRKHWAVLLGVTFHTQSLLDTKPVPVVATGAANGTAALRIDLLALTTVSG